LRKKVTTPLLSIIEKGTSLNFYQRETIPPPFHGSDVSFPPPLEGLGEATTTFSRMHVSNDTKSHLGCIAPLNLPQGETLDPVKEKANASFPPPLEGLGEANSNLVEKTRGGQILK
jgi:hypothetical protein